MIRERVMTRFFGPATLIERYRHMDTREIVWDVLSDDGVRMHLSERYVSGLRRL